MCLKTYCKYNKTHTCLMFHWMCSNRWRSTNISQLWWETHWEIINRIATIWFEQTCSTENCEDCKLHGKSEACYTPHPCFTFTRIIIITAKCKFGERMWIVGIGFVATINKLLTNGRWWFDGCGGEFALLWWWCFGAGIAVAAVSENEKKTIN